MGKYQDELIRVLQATEPEDVYEDGGETFKLYRLEGMSGVIVTEDEDGNVTGEFFDEGEDIDQAWEDLQVEEDDDDEEDEA